MTTSSHNEPWLTAARFEHEHRHAGIDRMLGTGWGARGDQELRLRADAVGGPGVLYLYDPLWDEYRILATDVHPLTAPAVSLEVAGHAAR